MACKVQNKIPIIIDCDGNSESISPINLGYQDAADKGTVTLTVGDDAVIPLVNLSKAGLMSPSDKVKLNGLSQPNLNYSASTINGTITNSAGTNAIIPLVGSYAGLMSPTQKVKLDSLSNTDLSYTPSTTDGTVNSSNGTDATIPLVGTNAGLMSPTQKTNLDFLVDSAKKTATFSSNGLTLSFSFNHGAGTTPTSVVITNTSADAKGYSHITVNSTQVTVNYDIAPPVGTNNLTFNAIILK